MKTEFYITSAVIFLMSFLMLFSFPLTEDFSLQAAGDLVVISSYRTSVEDQDSNVKTNIAIAASKLNGAVIPAGGVFSFNNTVGEGSAANGFLSGRVLYQDTAAYESGGGSAGVIHSF